MDEAKGVGRPLIGVTGPDEGHWTSWSCITLAVWLAGGRVRRLTPRQPRLRDTLDGLIIAGGRDIDPEQYGAARKPHYRYDEPRDRLEMDWAQQALAQGLPLLGLCRGMQMINVCLGGSLHLDIRLVCETAHYPKTILSKIFARKPVMVLEESRLGAILREEVVQVNSLHRQSLDRIGQGLAVTAREHNNIIQAVEGERPGHFLLGVQWHPEFMLNSAAQRRIFQSFMEYARKQREERRAYAANA